MAQAESAAACFERHRGYRIDISSRMTGIHQARLRWMLAGVQPHDAVLDVGCNSGYIVDFLPSTCRAHGVDASEELVGRARQRMAPERVQVAPAERLPWPDQAMDVVVLGEILEHVYDPLAVLIEARRVARRAIVGSTPHERGKWGPHGTRSPETHRFHVRCFTEDSLRRTLAAASLVRIEIAEITDGAGVPQIYVFRASTRDGA